MVAARIAAPGSPPPDRRPRMAATGDVAADILEFVYTVDARTALAEMTVPTLVMHRRGDEAVPFEHGRRLAGLVPGARLLPLEGRAHVPWLGHTRPVVEATTGFLRREDGDRRPPAIAHGRRAAPRTLTGRELEVLRLIAAGLADEQIAQALVVSPHTVHRHVANIRAKLRQSTRTAAAVEAARQQLI